MRDEAGRVTVTLAQRRAGPAGQDSALGAAPHHHGEHGHVLEVESRAARRLARDGLVVIDAGATARLSDRGRALMTAVPEA